MDVKTSRARGLSLAARARTSVMTSCDQMLVGRGILSLPRDPLGRVTAEGGEGRHRVRRSRSAAGSRRPLRSRFESTTRQTRRRLLNSAQLLRPPSRSVRADSPRTNPVMSCLRGPFQVGASLNAFLLTQRANFRQEPPGFTSSR